MAVPGKYSKLKQGKFLGAIAATGVLSQAASIAGTNIATHYNWLRNDPEYAKEFVAALRRAAIVLESKAFSRALKGRKRYKFTAKGEPIIDPRSEIGEQYCEIEYDNNLLWRLLSALEPAYHQQAEPESGVTNQQINIYLPENGRELPENGREALALGHTNGHAHNGNGRN